VVGCWGLRVVEIGFFVCLFLGFLSVSLWGGYCRDVVQGY